MIPDVTANQAISNKIVSDLEWIDTLTTGKAAGLAKYLMTIVITPPTAFMDAGIHVTWGALKIVIIAARECAKVCSSGKILFAKEISLQDIKEHGRQSVLFFICGLISSLTLFGTLLSATALCSAPFYGSCTPKLALGLAGSFMLCSAGTSLWYRPTRVVSHYRSQGLIKSEAAWKKEKFNLWLKELPERAKAYVNERANRVWHSMKQHKIVLSVALVAAGAAAIYFHNLRPKN